jgi:hypothetical protein
VISPIIREDQLVPVFCNVFCNLDFKKGLLHLYHLIGRANLEHWLGNLLLRKPEAHTINKQYRIICSPFPTYPNTPPALVLALFSHSLLSQFLTVLKTTDPFLYGMTLGLGLSDTFIIIRHRSLVFRIHRNNTVSFLVHHIKRHMMLEILTWIIWLQRYHQYFSAIKLLYLLL